jgi:hypothetical protein
MGRVLIVIGIVLVAVGLLMVWGVPFGRLPGDFSVRRGNVAFYFPLATSVVISVLFTLLLMLLRR